jgi:hypothetical protein
MPHVYQEDEPSHHPQRGVGPDEHRLILVLVVQEQVGAIGLVHITENLNNNVQRFSKIAT